MDKNFDPEEISIKEIAGKFRNLWLYISAKKYIILAGAVVGALLGLTYSIVKKPVYVADCTFVVEDGSKGGGLGQYSGLASLAGIDIGGLGGSSGIFNGDNILELYKSRIMIEKALLSKADFNGKQQLLIDRFIESENFRDNWKDKKELENISFSGNPDNFNRTQDSIVTSITELINKKVLIVDKVDKKLSIIRVQTQSNDELFSKYFNTKLVETVNDFYLQTKTKKSTQNIAILKHQADSVRNVLNSSISGVASAIDAAPNANPALLVLKVPSQKRQIDVQATAAIYSEMVKNLEISKMTLRQETPLIQVIDKPVLPLTKNKVGKVKGVLMGGILASFAVVFYLLVKIAFKKLLA